ncbi:MAG: HAD family hydrolase [Bacillota bacterium]|nr:HAD family hydrolase [Bacillota bacterium]
MIKTVMFDLDDTLFDHKYSRICALNAIKNGHEAISCTPVEDLEKEHEVLLSGNYLKVLDRTLTMNDSMVERTYLLFLKYGIELSEDEAASYTEIYKNTYEFNRRAVPGVKELIKLLKENYNIGIISNGLFDIQMEKLRICCLEDYFNFIILSEDIKARKPDKAIFEAALEKCGCKPEEVIYFGDSWETDILGASNCSIKTIWLNRYERNCPDRGLTYEIKSYDDIKGILDYIRSF